MSKVIQFPYERLSGNNECIEDNNLHDIFESLIIMFYHYGYPIDSSKDEHEYAFLFESLKSLLYKMRNREHGFQKLAETFYLEYSEDTNPRQLTFDFN